MGLAASITNASLDEAADVVRLVVREGLSVVSDLEVWFLAESPDLDLDAMIWSEAWVHVIDDDAPDARADERYHGIVEEAEYLDPRGDLHLYRARLRPRLHGLAYRVRTRIFQDQSVPDVVARVLREAGVPDASVVSHLGAYPAREYITQWKESELAFVQRLLEDEGIFFWFDCDDSGHVLHLADSGAVHEPVEGDRAFVCAEKDAHELDRESVTDLAWTIRTTPESYRSRDWNFFTPSTTLDGVQALDANSRREHYEFPGGFLTQAAGARKARDRMVAQAVTREELSGLTNSPRVRVGRRFELTDVYPPERAGEYLVWSLERRFHSRQFTRDDNTPAWEGTFRALPAASEFRPARVTPRPRVHGKESAVVTSQGSEEIHVDALGRIKVHFYWDREGPVDDTASCWVRVQQQNTAGSMVLPRVGWEVDVGFLFGDPDRPVVLQKLYNRETAPPYGLPDNLMQSSWQSSSSPGGGGTNEIRMNDGNGGMEFFVHAQKDLKVMAGNNLSERVGVDARIQVGANNTRNVGGSESIAVDGDQSIGVVGAVRAETVASRSVSIGGNDTVGVSAMYAINTTGARSESIGGLMNVLAQKVAETFNADHSRSVGGALSLNAGRQIADTVAGAKRETIGGARILLVTGSAQESVGAAKALNAGMVRYKTGADMTVAAEGALALNVGGSLTIKCGDAFTLSGSQVRITVGTAKLRAGAKVTATPGSINIQGSSVGGSGAKLKLKGTVKYK